MDACLFCKYNSATIFLFLCCLCLSSVTVEFAHASCMHKDNTTCQNCVMDFNCYWCVDTHHCSDITIGRHFLGRIRKDCGGGEWFSYKQCAINGKYVSHIIFASVLIGVLLMVTIIGMLCFHAYKRRNYDMIYIAPRPRSTYYT